MTKTEAREFLRRCEAGVKDARAALGKDDVEGLQEALMEIGGAAGTIESALHPLYGDGVGGLKLDPESVGF